MDKIREVADKIALEYQPEKIILFGSFAWGTPNKDSDIDLFIVIEQGHIWLSRFLITMLLSIFRLRRTKKKINDRLCLSFYVTDKNLDLSRISIDGEDIYLAYWLSNLTPVYDPQNLLKRIVKENVWATETLRHFGNVYNMGQLWRVEKLNRMAGFVNFFEKIWSTEYGNLLEDQARSIQMSKMRKNKSVQDEQDTRVVINDEMLKFHENDRRKLYRQKWQEKCIEYGVVE